MVREGKGVDNTITHLAMGDYTVQNIVQRSVIVRYFVVYGTLI